jgi:hypothetical protein
MQHVDFAVIVANPVNKRRFLKTHEILFAFQRRHQLVTHLLDVFEMAERNVTLKNIVGRYSPARFISLRYR